MLVVVAWLNGCSTHQGIKPLQPEVGHYSPVVVDSLRPTFRWQAAGDANARYDFVIFADTGSGNAGKSVYYREGLKQTEHKIDEDLKPNANYYWSVRTRADNDLGEWATYEHKVLVPVPFGFYYKGQDNLHFPFKTPAP
jgi:hypothetical protein